MAFRVGQKVVCVDAEACPVWGALTLQKGRVYTVTRYYIPRHGIPCVRLSEDASPHPEGGYQARRFRPVVERKTDISIFKAMLTDKRQVASQGETARD